MKNKSIKLYGTLLAIFIFFVASVNVFADCSAFTEGAKKYIYGNPITIAPLVEAKKKNCESLNENGFKCVATTKSLDFVPSFVVGIISPGSVVYELTCSPSNDCIGGYSKVDNKCVKDNTCGSYNSLYKEQTDSYGARCKVVGTIGVYESCDTIPKSHCGKNFVKVYTNMKTNISTCEWNDKNNKCENKEKVDTNIGVVVPPDNGVNTSPSFNVNFNMMEGYNNNGSLACSSNTSLTSPNVCYGYVKSGTKVSVPSNANDFVTVGEGALLGWTTSLDSNGNAECTQKSIIKSLNSVEVDSEKNYFACYKEVINGERFLTEDDAIPGYKCGDSVGVVFCKKDVGSDKEYCLYDAVKADYSVEDGLVEKSKLSKKALCSTSSNDSGSETQYKGERYVISDSDSYKCGDVLYITTCANGYCTYRSVNGKTIDGDVLQEELRYYPEDKNEVESKCNNKIDDTDKKCPSIKTKKDRTGEGTIEICYDVDASKTDIRKLLKDYYKCDDDYIFDNNSVDPEGDGECNDYICTRTYSVACIPEDEEEYKPYLSVTSGVVGSDGTGVISVKSGVKNAKINGYYVSEYYAPPTLRSDWTKTNGTFTIKDTPGIKYIWVKDDNDNISNAVSGAIFDTVNTDTTLNSLALYDSNGAIQTPSRVSYEVDGLKSSKYVLMSNNLNNDSDVLADGFNPFDMEYKLEVDGPTVSVYATLTSRDSKYVEGYEPRTVNLKYGINTVLIKILNKEGKIRTYTILVTRKDNRTSDNTLNDITLSVGNINFNANVTDYKISIPDNTNSVNVSSVISSDKANYVSGYEPGEVKITGDTTVKLIKVISETGSTRTYVLTFVKEKSDLITDETLQLFDLTIPGVYVPFESEVANYSLSASYETDMIDINADTKNKDSYTVISVKNKNSGYYQLVSGDGVVLDVGENFIEIKVVNSEGEASYYRLTIIRKEIGLEVSNDTTLKDLKVLGFDIKFNPNEKDYTVRIKQEKSLIITAVPNNNRAEVFIRGNEELTGFSTVRVKVVAENGEFETYSIDIKKDVFNKPIEIGAIIVGTVIILGSSCIIILKNKKKKEREYVEE